MKRRLQILVGSVFALALLWFLFKDTNWGTVYTAVRNANLFWMGLALLVVTLSFFVRILRWGPIVRTAKPVSYRNMFSATQIGFLANFTLPGRIGEVIRAVVLSRLEQLPFSKCFAFVALDRVTDLVGLMMIMLVAIFAYRPETAIQLPEGVDFPEWAQVLLQPEAIRTAALTSAAFLLLVVGAFVLLYVNQRLFLRISDFCVGLVSKRLAERLHHLLLHFAEGLHIFRSLKDMGQSLFYTTIVWGSFALSYVFFLKAFNLALPWYAPFIILSLLSVAISLPGAPGFVGQFHAAIIGALIILDPGMDMDVARAIAICAHLFNLVLVAILGLYCLYREDFGLSELRQEGDAAESESLEGDAS